MKRPATNKQTTKWVNFSIFEFFAISKVVMLLVFYQSAKIVKLKSYQMQFNESLFIFLLGKGNPSIVAILEENKRLKQDKERLAEKLSQSKGALRETLDRLHKKDASTLRLLEQRLRHINLQCTVCFGKGNI